MLISCAITADLLVCFHIRKISLEGFLMIQLISCPYFQPCNEKLFQFVKENLLIIAGVSIGIAVILVSLQCLHPLLFHLYGIYLL